MSLQSTIREEELGSLLLFASIISLQNTVLLPSSLLSRPLPLHHAASMQNAECRMQHTLLTSPLSTPQIKPYNPYTIHTSLLTYDHKWIYFISHFIRPDFRLSRRGSSTLLHESRDEAVNAIKVKARGKAGRQEATATREMAEKAVLATVISKNIFRLGREKVVPERVLRAVNLLPSSSSSSSKSVGSRLGGLSMEEVEERRKRGMKVVESNDGDVAHAWFGEMWAEGAEKEGEEGGRVLAEYRDWFAFG